MNLLMHYPERDHREAHDAVGGPVSHMWSQRPVYVLLTVKDPEGELTRHSSLLL